MLTNAAQLYENLYLKRFKNDSLIEIVLFDRHVLLLQYCIKTAALFWPFLQYYQFYTTHSCLWL